MNDDTPTTMEAAPAEAQGSDAFDLNDAPEEDDDDDSELEEEGASAPPAESALEPSADILHTLDRLRELAANVDDKSRELAAAKEAAKEAKAEWEAACLAEHNYVKRLTSPGQSMPLFDQPPADNTISLVGVAAEDGTPPDESWRAVPLSEALEGLTARQVGLLEAGTLHTVGELADYTGAEGGRKRLTDLKGVGPALIDKIDKAMTDFWARRSLARVPDPQPAAQAEEGAGTDAE